MRTRKAEYITEIVLHCSDSSQDSHNDISVIRGWHMSERHFEDVGYQYFITTNGDIQVGRPELVVGAHCRGHNSRSIGICLHGKDRFAPVQFVMLKPLIMRLCEDYPIKRIYYHNELNENKTCPNFKKDWIDKINKQLAGKDGGNGNRES